MGYTELAQTQPSSEQGEGSCPGLSCSGTAPHCGEGAIASGDAQTWRKQSWLRPGPASERVSFK